MLPFPSPQYPFDISFPGQFEAVPPPPRPNQSPPFLPFSPPILDGLHELLLATQLLPTSDVVEAAPPLPPPVDPSPNKETSTAPTPPAKSSRLKTMGRKRAMRKDRHSKIFTAQGPRDRRMRLSLEVARRFFDLQDLLGFDKPSKTVQWLLTKSKSAIKDIASTSSRPKGQSFSSSVNSLKSESSTSECEDVSTISDYKGKSSARVATSEANASKAKRASARPSRKAAVHPALVRESRAKARARARERTREKKRILVQCGFPEGDKRPNHLVEPSIPFDAIEEESISQDPKSSLELAAEVELCSSSHNRCNGRLGEIVLESFPVVVGSGPSPLFDYHLSTIGNNDGASIIQEQWDMHFPGNIVERVLLGDVHLHTKPWEAYNNPIL